MGWDKLDGSTNTIVTHANVNACTYPLRENALKSVYVRVCVSYFIWILTRRIVIPSARILYVHY